MTAPRRNYIARQGDLWFDDYALDDEEQEDDFQIDEYDITATPNDFNILTIFNFLESGAIKIPDFQRNYVWDLSRASKLIESLILGLPVPQIFLYEEGRNRFLVIDGQQRLMSIYYFIKQRFPRKEKRVELRSIFEKHARIPDHVLHDDDFFTNFRLHLPSRAPGVHNKFHGLNYATLTDYKLQFDLRPIRNVVVKQNSPKDDDSSIYEIFNRLNSGGVNLWPQEIRASLYHSKFYEMLYRINTVPEWRRIIQLENPDLHMKDIEILLRGFAMLIDSQNYAPSLARFLNVFSKKSRKNAEEQNTYLADLFLSFLIACQNLPDDAFINKQSHRLNIALLEAAFVAACEPAFKNHSPNINEIPQDKLRQLENDQRFIVASRTATAKSVNVEERLNRARAILQI